MDASAVEVFGGDGRATLTSLLLPEPDAQGMSFYATGGTARIVTLDVHRLADVFRVTDRDPDRPAPPAPDGGAGSVLLRASADAADGYAVNLDPNLRTVRLFRRDAGRARSSPRCPCSSGAGPRCRCASAPAPPVSRCSSATVRSSTPPTEPIGGAGSV